MASKNKENLYWANPNVNIINKDWHLILNDTEEKKLYHFYIPENSIHQREIVTRTDKPHQLSLHIQHKDFIDNDSNFDFSKFLKDILPY